MAKKFNISKKSDMKRFKKALYEEFYSMVEQAEQELLSKKYEVKCPACHCKLSIKPGKTRCPICDEEIDFILEIH